VSIGLSSRSDAAYVGLRQVAVQPVLPRLNQCIELLVGIGVPELDHFEVVITCRQEVARIRVERNLQGFAPLDAVRREASQPGRERFEVHRFGSNNFFHMLEQHVSRARRAR